MNVIGVNDMNGRSVLFFFAVLFIFTPLSVATAAPGYPQMYCDNASASNPGTCYYYTSADIGAINADSAVMDGTAVVATETGLYVISGTYGWSVSAGKFSKVEVTDDGELKVDNETGNALLATMDADTSAMATDLAAIEVLNTGIETAVELIDDAVFTDDTAFTPGTSKGLAVGFQVDETSPDSVDEGDFGVPRMTADRKVRTLNSPRRLDADNLSMCDVVSDSATVHTLQTGSDHFHICAYNNTVFINCEDEDAEAAPFDHEVGDFPFMVADGQCKDRTITEAECAHIAVSAGGIICFENDLE
jgi:hypothetical protein